MHLRTLGLAFAVTLLGACGGGGGGGGGSSLPRPGSATTVSGTAAANTALGSIAVEVFAPSPGAPPNALSAQAFSTTSAANGTYSVTTSASVQAPFLIRTGGTTGVQDSDAHYPRLYSTALRGGGISNVTPLTSLAIARVLNRKPSFVVDLRAVFELQNVTEAQLNAAQQQVVNYLLTRPSKDNGNIPAPVDVAAVTNFFTMPLSAAPGDPYFEALKRLHDSLMDSESIQGVEEHMLFGNDAAANLAAMLALDFPANCTPEGSAIGTPQGTTQIVLNPFGATFGTAINPANLLFQPGDNLSLTAEHSLEQRWVFSFAFGTSSVELRLFDGRLSFVRVSLLGASSLCVPTSELSVSDKDPSLTALVRLFAQAINNPSSSSPAVFQCSLPTSFFQNGANLLIIDNNGALRINNPTGPALHLPSLNITMNADLVVTSGQVSLIQPRRFAASRLFKGGRDELAVAFTNAGQITGLRLARQQNGAAIQAQNCGTI